MREKVTDQKADPQQRTITVGRFVHMGVSPPCSLWVGAVNADGTVNGLLLFPDGATETKTNIPYSETPSDTAWSWPPRV